MSFGGTSQKCHVCTKTAYEMEAMTYDKMTFHKTCFKCLSCKSQVSLGSVAMISGDLYCKPCFLKKFKEKGQYSSFGEKTLPKAQQDAAKAGDGAAPAAAPAKEAPAKADPPKVAAEPAAAKPARPASTSVSMPAAGNRITCYKCTKVVYEMELITYDKMNFHKSCFRCLKCNNIVGLGSVAMISGDLYCKPCFLKTFKEKGKYSSFGEKTLPKAQQGKAGEAAPAAAAAAPAKTEAAPAAAAAPAAEPAKPAEAAPAAAAEPAKPAEPAPAAAAEPAPAAAAPAEAAPAAAAPAEAAPAAAAAPAEAAPAAAAPAEAAPAAAAPAEAAPAAAAPAEAAPAAAPAEAAPAAAPAEAAPAAAPAEAAPAEAAPAAAPAADAPAS